MVSTFIPAIATILHMAIWQYVYQILSKIIAFEASDLLRVGGCPRDEGKYTMHTHREYSSMINVRFQR